MNKATDQLRANVILIGDGYDIDIDDVDDLESIPRVRGAKLSAMSAFATVVAAMLLFVSVDDGAVGRQHTLGVTC